MPAHEPDGPAPPEPDPPPGGDEHATQLLAHYDDALPQVYGYLARRCPTATLAEDLTAETFLAAVDSIRRGAVQRVTVAWLVTIARNKLVDHWRRHEREQRGLQLVQDLAPAPTAVEWADGHELDVTGALAVLHTLGPHHQAALSLRYLDGLSVPNVADQLGRTVHATEALLVRARAAFRTAYEAQERDTEHDDHAEARLRPATPPRADAAHHDGRRNDG